MWPMLETHSCADYIMHASAQWHMQWESRGGVHVHCHRSASQSLKQGKDATGIYMALQDSSSAGIGIKACLAAAAKSMHADTHMSAGRPWSLISRLPAQANAQPAMIVGILLCGFCMTGEDASMAMLRRYEGLYVARFLLC